jgi:co-chaperonin GroES (HSP10)
MTVLGNNILIKRDEMKVSSKQGSILLPGEKSQMYGEVVQLGTEVPADSPIKIGDKILWASGIMGVSINTEDGERCILKSSDVVAIL